MLNRICYHLYMLIPMRAPAWVSDRAIRHMDYRSALIHVTVGRFVLKRGDGEQTGTTPPIKVEVLSGALSESQWAYALHSMGKVFMQNAGMSRLEMVYDGCQMTLTLDEKHTTETP